MYVSLYQVYVRLPWAHRQLHCRCHIRAAKRNPIAISLTFYECLSNRNTEAAGQSVPWRVVLNSERKPRNTNSLRGRCMGSQRSPCPCVHAVEWWLSVLPSINSNEWRECFWDEENSFRISWFSQVKWKEWRRKRENIFSILFSSSYCLKMLKTWATFKINSHQYRDMMLAMPMMMMAMLMWYVTEVKMKIILCCWDKIVHVADRNISRWSYAHAEYVIGSSTRNTPQHNLP